MKGYDDDKEFTFNPSCEGGSNDDDDTVDDDDDDLKDDDDDMEFTFYPSCEGGNKRGSPEQASRHSHSATL